MAPDHAHAHAVDTPESEQACLAQIRAGDVAAFARVFRAHVDALCDFAFGYVHVRESAEEIVQDVFARFWAERATLDCTGNLRGYLFVAVRNRALNVLRRAQTEERWASHLAVDAQAAVNDDSEPDETLEGRLRQAIAALPERQRAAIQMRWLHRLSYAEIARALGVTPKTVENHLARALRQLRQLLGDRR